jgi:hypothetical protein
MASSAVSSTKCASSMTSARRRSQRPQIGVLGRRPTHRHRDAAPDLLGDLCAQLVGQKGAAQIGGRRLGQRQRGVQELARVLVPRAAQDLLGANEHDLKAR